MANLILFMLKNDKQCVDGFRGVRWTEWIDLQLGALDATVHQVMASRFGIKGFPTIKYFAPGSGADDAVDYDGGRSSSDIVQWALNKVRFRCFCASGVRRVLPAYKVQVGPRSCFSLRGLRIHWKADPDLMENVLLIFDVHIVHDGHILSEL